MPEPTSTAAVATLAVAAVAAPVLTVAGVPLGLRADMLALGFAGSIAAIGLLNIVPSSGDTWREMLRTSFRRIFAAVCSALFAAAAAPLLASWFNLDETGPALNGLAFVLGAGAQTLLRKLIAGIGVKLDPTGADKPDTKVEGPKS